MPKLSNNSLSLQGTIWIASDIHLGPSIPNTLKSFKFFLNQAIKQTDHLFLVGDIFDFWIGDDYFLNTPPKWLIEITEQLKSFATKKNLYLMHGNRDFLLGHRFAQSINATLLPDQIFLTHNNNQYFVTHGDELCTQDIKYMRFRKFSHNIWVQKAFLLLPLSLRLKIAFKARKSSQNNYQYSKDISDVNLMEIERILNNNPHLSGIIHGHTHRPAVHQHQLNNIIYHRWVLHDWEFDHSPLRGGFLTLQEQQLPQLINWPLKNKIA